MGSRKGGKMKDKRRARLGVKGADSLMGKGGKWARTFLHGGITFSAGHERKVTGEGKKEGGWDRTGKCWIGVSSIQKCREIWERQGLKKSR